MNFLWRNARDTFVVALFFFATLNAQAIETDVDARALVIAKQNACLGCHSANKKIVGPSFQDVAAKYKSNPNASTYLKNKIFYGGAGNWGVVPMPANNKLSDSDLSILVPWVLRGAPSPN